ncbi:MAG: hypothetical protein LW724_10620 [Planctomycetaceae bacterium]|jgi:hypothetical protein|nr:hypothetical protein [Planctomycetaceae bacterium]
MNADAALEENRSAFALLADERERRALILRGTAQSIFFMGDSSLNLAWLLWLFP